MSNGQFAVKTAIVDEPLQWRVHIVETASSRSAVRDIQVDGIPLR